MSAPFCYPHYRSALAEGPLWHAGHFYWVDIEEGKILTENDGAVEVVRDVGFRVTALLPRQSGGFLLASERGVFALETLHADLQLVADPERSDPRTRLNDAKCDPWGRLWVGSMGFQSEPEIGSLYRIDPGFTCVRVLTGITIANGLAWSMDGGTLYFIDSVTRRVQAYRYSAATGAAGNGRAVIAIPEGDGYPDGMTIDCAGNLWIALWDGGKVACYNPATGAEIDRILLPVTRPSSCAFGGAQMDELLITTARHGLGEAELAKQPLAGAVFKARLPVQGLPPAAFAG